MTKSVPSVKSVAPSAPNPATPEESAVEARPWQVNFAALWWLAIGLWVIGGTVGGLAHSVLARWQAASLLLVGVVFLAAALATRLGSSWGQLVALLPILGYWVFVFFAGGLGEIVAIVLLPFYAAAMAPPFFALGSRRARAWFRWRQVAVTASARDVNHG